MDASRGDALDPLTVESSPEACSGEAGQCGLATTTKVAAWPFRAKGAQSAQALK
jgi:hypothetical protein